MILILIKNDLVDCGKNIKVEPIKEKFNDKDNVEDPFYLHSTYNKMIIMITLKSL